MLTTISLPARCTAFAGSRRVAHGDPRQVALKLKTLLDQRDTAPILIFDDVTSQIVELDLRGTPETILRRLDKLAPKDDSDAPPETTARGPGRPKLGVVAREVTLLPRHWEWLASQPGGASVALRKLVENARRENADADRLRQARDAAYRFMSAMAGNEPGFEEATRALFAGDQIGFQEKTKPWPKDIREHTKGLAEAVFAS